MTDKIKHHLGDDILLAYSAGTLPEAFSLMVATHISLCDTCRAQLETFDSVGGAMLEEDAVALDEDSLEATFAAIAADHPDEARKPRASCGVLPAPLQDYVGGDLSAVKWRPVGMGVKQAILPTAKGATARLLYIPAGAAVPDHGHSGTELTMVLQGAFSDEIDSFARGDVETADEDVNHTPVADISEDCICLAVTDAPLKFNSLIPRLVQPLLRI
ncbi:ChrR family anti-sigma-E factor [Arenibacterium sp. CAU 1754]